MPKYLIQIAILLFSIGAAQANDGAKAPSYNLFFPFEKNNVQILPQRFEYELLDKDQFRIGNALFDARLFEFEVNQKKEGNHKLMVRWPATLLSNGEITIRDNIGKAVWVLPVTKSTTRLQRKKQGTGSILTAQVEGDLLPPRIFDQLQYLPYFRVCIQKADQLTRIAICSKDFYFPRATAKDGKKEKEIMSRDSDRKESFVNINGNKVDPVGLIFLQGVSSVISLRVLLLSGAQIEVDTRLKKVDFRDMYMSEDGERLVVSAFGAEPVAGQKISRMEDGSWRTELNINRPVIYLKGEGDIPMKQEFVTEGNIRRQLLKVESLDSLPRFTYSDQIRVRLKKNPLYKISSPDELSKLEERDAETMNWTLLNLSEGVRNRRLVRINQGEEYFMAAWEVERHLPWTVKASVGLPLMARVHFERWFDNQHLSLGGDFEHNFTGSKSEDKSAQRMRGLLYWSIPRHINMKDTGWGVLLAPQSFTFETVKTQSVQAGLFYRSPLPSKIKMLGDQFHFESELFGAGAGEPTLSNALMMRVEFMNRIEGARYWFWGLEARQGRISGGNDQVQKLELNAGLSLVF